MPVNTNQKEGPMGIKHRKQTGALTPYQFRVLKQLHAGRTMTQVSNDDGVKLQTISTEVTLVRAKMGVKTTAQAVARYACHLELLKVAVNLTTAMVVSPIDEAEEHVNHVLAGLADLYQKKAEGLMPHE